MAAQLTYGYETAKGVAGLLADISFSTVATRTNEENDGTLKFGMAVKTGTTAGSQVKVPTSGTEASAIEGVAIRHENTEEDATGKAVVKKGATVSVLKKGRIWGRISQFASVTAGTAARVIVDGDEAGCFTNKSAKYEYYAKCASTDTGALEVVADDTANPTSSQIKLASVTPVGPTTWTPAVGNYVVKIEAHGATVDIGAKFGENVDTTEGVAVISL